jgi:hypothetical protein
MSCGVQQELFVSHHDLAQVQRENARTKINTTSNHNQHLPTFHTFKLQEHCFSCFILDDLFVVVL